MNQTSLLIFAIFLCSYLFVDYVFLPLDRTEKNQKLISVLVGGIIMAGMVYLLFGDWRNFLIPLSAFVIFIFNRSIQYLIKKKNVTFSFFQLFLWLAFFILAALFIPGVIPSVSTWHAQFEKEYLLVLISLAGLLYSIFPGSQLIGQFLGSFQAEMKKTRQGENPMEGLKQGGKWIGILERVLVYIFVLSGQYAAIGFLVAAKSILRFGEVKETENRMQAEYIIIGTLASILFALVCGLVTSWLLRRVN